MTPHASLLSAARAAGATVLETPGAIVMVLAVAPAAPAAAGDLLPLVDAARTAATSVRVLRNAIRAGELAAVGRQRDRAVRRADLDRWIEGRRVGAPSTVSDAQADRVERALRARGL